MELKISPEHVDYPQLPDGFYIGYQQGFFVDVLYDRRTYSFISEFGIRTMNPLPTVIQIEYGQSRIVRTNN